MRSLVSENAVRRLPKYLRALKHLEESGAVRVSSAELGKLVGMTPSQIRQDLSSFGEFGIQGYGYNVTDLSQQIEIIMGTDRGHRAILVGCGGLGRSLIQNFSFEEQGVQLVAAFDMCEDLIGTKMNGVPVYSAKTLPEFLSCHEIDMAVLAVPKRSAKSVANQLIEYGIRAFWNFTNEDVISPYSDILVENVHFSDSLLSLSYYMAEKTDYETRMLHRMNKIAVVS